jgi:hypothetical protein
MRKKQQLVQKRIAFAYLLLAESDPEIIHDLQSVLAT